MINFQKIKEFTSKIEHWFESLNLKYELKENYYIVSHMGRDYAIIPILDDIELESLESLHKDLVYISLKENFIPNQVVLLAVMAKKEPKFTAVQPIDSKRASFLKSLRIWCECVRL